MGRRSTALKEEGSLRGNAQRPPLTAPPPQISVPSTRSHVVLPDLLSATKYRVLVSAVYGAGESIAVSATYRTG